MKYLMIFILQLNEKNNKRAGYERKKISLIESVNPGWRDLSKEWYTNKEF